MRRCSTGILLFIAILLVLALTACLGKSSPGPGSQGVTSVTLSPSTNFSMDVGANQVFSATARNASGGVVAGSPQFFVTTPPGATNPAPLSMTSAGNACAGAWDTTGTLCTAGQPGVAVVTAVIDGVSSPPTTVYVHLHIDNLQVSSLQTTPTSSSCYQKGPCCSQGQTWLYQALAYNNGVDITNTIGQPTWLLTNNTVMTAATYLPPQQPSVLNQAQITGGSPGITRLYAQASGTTSNSLQLTTCLVSYVRVRAEGLTGDSITVNSGTTVPIDATAIDTEGYTLTKAPLTWSTNNPEVVSFGTPSNSTGVNNASARTNTGGADVTASCTPPTCNIGLTPGVPVYASDGILPNGLQGYGTIAINVAAGSSPPTYVGWAGTDQCLDVSGCTSVIFQITPGTTQNPITATATAPRTPNSFLFNFQSGSRLYMGSDQGLMYTDVSSSPTVNEISASTSPCNASLCGKVLAISNDGKQVVVSDDVSPTPQVYIYNSAAQAGGTVTDLVLPGVGGEGSLDVAQSAAFSPDQSKIFVLTNGGKMFVNSTVAALTEVPIPPAGTDVAFSADGSFAYVSTGSTTSTGLMSAYSTCSTPGVPSTLLASPVATADVPLLIFPSPNLPASDDGLIHQNVFVLESSSNNPTRLQVMEAQFTQTAINDSQFVCIPPANNFSLTAGPAFNLGAGSFTPLYTRLTGDGSEFIVVGKDVPSVVVFNVASGTATGIPLIRDGYGTIHPYSASATSDGSLVFVAACDQFEPDGVTCAAGSVHIVNTLLGADTQQVPYINYTTNNMCNNLGGDQALCVPDLVAIKPN